MAQLIKETITTGGNKVRQDVAVPIKVEATSSETLEYLVYFFFGLIEVLLAFRLVFKAMGASVSSSFVNFIYGITGIFILPFEGIFRRGFNPGLETTSVLEPSTLVAFVVYIILAWGIVKLIRISSGELQEE